MGKPHGAATHVNNSKHRNAVKSLNPLEMTPMCATKVFLLLVLVLIRSNFTTSATYHYCRVPRRHRNLKNPFQTVTKMRTQVAGYAMIRSIAFPAISAGGSRLWHTKHTKPVWYGSNLKR
jgi:hypothetical protein